MDNPVFLDDIMIWPDGFWCFRKEFLDNIMRGSGYRIVLKDSEEWVKLTTPVVPASVRVTPV